MILPYNFPYIYCCPCSSVVWVSTAMQVLSLGKFVRGLRVGELVVGLRPPEATPGAGNPLVGPMFSIWCKTESLPAVPTIFWCIRKVSEGRIDYHVSGRYDRIRINDYCNLISIGWSFHVTGLIETDRYDILELIHARFQLDDSTHVGHPRGLGKALD